MLRAEVGMRVRCANKLSAEWFRRERGIGQNPRKICKKRGIFGCCALRRAIKRKAREQRSSWHAEHEVHSAEVKVCLSARKARIVLPLSHKRLWRDRNSFLVRGLAVNRKAPPSRIQTIMCKWAACGLAAPPYHRAKPIYLPSNATDASRGRPPGFFETLARPSTLKASRLYTPKSPWVPVEEQFLYCPRCVSLLEPIITVKFPLYGR